MNWIKENKFLFGFILVMVIGTGVGGFLVLGAKGRYDEAYTNYESRAAELNRLQRLPTFPNKKNLDRLAEQKDQVNVEVNGLASTLAVQQIPLEELSPEQFQDRLKAAVTGVRAKASQSVPAVKLPSEKFFLGFERYETAPPPKEAASELGRELKAIEWLCNQLITRKVAEIKSLTREDLPEEKGRVRTGTRRAATPAPAKAPPGKPGAKGGPVDKGGRQHEVEKHRIDVVFVAEQSRFRDLLNDIVKYKGQFFIPRLTLVKNEKVTAPTRSLVPAAAEAPAAPAPDAAAGAAPAAPGGAPAAGSSNYIVGEEKIEVTLALEMVDFSEASAAK